MLAIFVLVYLFVTLIIGYLASKLVKNSKDFLLAGRNLPLSISVFALFATWFGAETVLGASSKMAKEGLYGVIEDPFGAALCLILVGLFFAKRLYKLNILTFGDFYKLYYGRKVEVVASIMLAMSYFGWIAAQMVAIGIIAQISLGVSKEIGLLIGFSVVVFYTFLGGMWAVSLNDAIQTIFIIVGLSVALYQISSGSDSIFSILSNQPSEYYKFFPDLNTKDILLYISSWIVIGLGSIPQQDIFQRVMSARSERVAVLSSILAGFMYLSVAFIPLTLAVIAKAKHPELLDSDAQLMLPTLILNYTGVFTQILFFGALFSAIMSTASGAVLASSSVIGENLVRPLLKIDSDRVFLWVVRICILFVSLISLLFAFVGESIYELVASSSALSLVSLFIPMVGAMFFGVRDSKRAMLSIVSGFSVWVVLEYVFSWDLALLAGLAASFISFAAYKLTSKLISKVLILKL